MAKIDEEEEIVTTTGGGGGGGVGGGKERWGTWEELLLACAVKKHGTKNWESVAMEIQNRSSSHLVLTSQNCKQKYYDLHHRFKVMNKQQQQQQQQHQDVDVDDDDDDDVKITDQHHLIHLKKIDDKIPWLDELRKLRVAELRREVQRSDVSIVSLQLKVKKLKEEREQSLREKDSSDGKPDLDDEKSDEEKKLVRDSEPEKSFPAVQTAGKLVSGDESDRENQSFNESNSTDLKSENREVGGGEKEPGPVEPVSGNEPDPVRTDDKPVGEGSYNGSSDTIAKESVVPDVKKESVETILVRETRDSGTELWESVAESKGGGGGGGGSGGDEGTTKESSDVQSSASLSRKNRRRKIVSGSSSGEDRETDEVSPAIKRISVKSQPLAGFLEIIQSHKYGSLFESRLESQETTNYKGLIRQHIDLEIVQTRLKEGRYSSCNSKFFRDLLLLFNNAIVFFPKNSNEYSAAIELRQLVTKELTSRSRNESQSPQEQLTTPTTTTTTTTSQQQPQQPEPPQPPQPPAVIPKLDPELSDSLVKPKTSIPIIACRKRSSLSAKAAANEKKGGEQKEAAAAAVEEIPVVSSRKQNEVDDEDQILAKKRKGDRPVSGARSSRTNGKSRNNGKNSNSNQNPSPNLKLSSSGKGSANIDDNSEVKTEEKKNESSLAATVAKKRSGVASFLNRMKRNASANGPLLETLKSSPVNNSSSKGGGTTTSAAAAAGEQKKSSGRREQNTRQSSSSKQDSPAKRSVGRPPKRAPPPPAPSLPRSSSKRAREAVETEVVAPRQPRKRSRR